MRIESLALCRMIKCERGIAALEFAFLAPVLLMLVFSTIVYSIYFTATIGVRQAAAEAARAAVQGLSSTERASLAKARGAAVIENYRSILGSNTAPVITTAADGTGVFKVTVSYDMARSPIMRFNGLLPLPSGPIQSSVSVVNGGY